MHILLFFTFDISLEQWFEMGFAERELELYNRLSRSGYRVTFLTYGDDRDLVFQRETGNVQVMPVYKHLRRPDNLILRLLQSLIIPIYLRNILSSVDVYKTNQMYGSWVPVLAKVFYHKRLVVRCGYEYLFDAIMNTKNKVVGFLKLFPRYLLEFFAYKCADVVVISSNFGKQFITKYFKISDRKINVISNYVDTNKFVPAKFDKRKASSNIVFVGRLHPAKNLFPLLEALENSTYTLDLIGGGVQEGDLKKFVSRGKIKARFLGVVSHKELARILPNHRVFVLPSIYENNPKALLEAMACSLPIVASNILGIREIIKHGHNGLLCEPNPVSIRHAIDTLMYSPGLREILGRNARITARHNFSINVILAHERKLYKQLLTGAR
jgi:glycosyltransferase involved in cell wall biosynthesis